MRVAGRVRYYIKQLLFIIVGNFPKIIHLTQHFIHYCKGSIEQEARGGGLPYETDGDARRLA